MQPICDVLVVHGSFLDCQSIGCACSDDAPIIDVQFRRPRAGFPAFCFAEEGDGVNGGGYGG